MEKEKTQQINLISNLNTIDLKQFKKDDCLSYKWLCLEEYFNKNNMVLILVNQDKNHIYFKVLNSFNNKYSYVMDITYKDLLNLDIYTANAIKENVLNWIN